MKEKYRQINPNDTVVVVLENIEKGERVAGVLAKENVAFGHKMAIKTMLPQEEVIKYGVPIGHATREIAAGSWVHTHNMATNLSGTLTYTYSPEKAAPFSPMVQGERTFDGYLRHNGDVGIRNDLYIVPTVGCINQTLQKILDTFQKKYPDLANLYDNCLLLKHPYGCSQLGQDHENTKNFLADVVCHPNAGSVLVVGLGCENNTISAFKEMLAEKGGDKNRIKFLVAQEVADEVAEGVSLLVNLATQAKKDRRTKQPLKKLRMGLKCGGSDGFSGITANPLLGLFSDYLIKSGGTTVLTEVPEMFGAEEILMNRAASTEVFEQIVAMINGFKEYFLSNNEPVYENPSPGNKEGGITTLEDKSLGCTQKSGNAKIVGVLNYTQRIQKNGLHLLEGPGNDLVATSSLGASGCHMVLFTTGRGNPFGTFVPTVKISSNTKLAEHKPNWIDFDAGKILVEETEKILEAFIEYIIQVASGEKTKNEANAYQEIALFKKGITL